ncbi:MFS transporter [Glacieibacterium megasporae]|uniref:MFS transporter n=1 Tax=Glacieibacterium megasporae TaxID=2835787 RepID=UPI001C1E8183|nr:MFS transporter [Polymorphobacter megasporae]UAJ10938.1 MFS transporter [Polymorphobacter megasporae]
MPIARHTPAYRALATAMLVAGFATFALLYCTQPLLPRFAAEFAITPAAASLAVSLATGPLAVAILFAAVVADRVGHRPVMIGALAAAAVLTALTAAVPGWHLLLVMRLLTGVALAGIPAVAMAYIADEVDAAAIGPAMGLYIAGSAIGGMAGRLGVAVVTEHFGWRVAIAATGATGIVAAIAFGALVPRSAGFVARRPSRALWLAGVRRIFADGALPWLYAAAFVLMGVFVTVYNYVGFRLRAAPYGLGDSAVGAVFLLYIVGSFSSAWVGGIAGRRGRRKIFWMPVVALIAGVALTAATPLPLVILGIAVVTAGFFGAHSIASSWVGRRARGDRAQAAALYLFFYYLGSSVLGSAGGVAWSSAGWPGVAGFCGVLGVAALGIGARLSGVPPLPEPEESVALASAR